MRVISKSIMVVDIVVVDPSRTVRRALPRAMMVDMVVMAVVIVEEIRKCFRLGFQRRAICDGCRDGYCSKSIVDGE